MAELPQNFISKLRQRAGSGPLAIGEPQTIELTPGPRGTSRPPSPVLWLSSILTGRYPDCQSSHILKITLASLGGERRTRPLILLVDGGSCMAHCLSAKCSFRCLLSSCLFLKGWLRTRWPACTTCGNGGLRSMGVLWMLVAPWAGAAGQTWVLVC